MVLYIYLYVFSSSQHLNHVLLSMLILMEKCCQKSPTWHIAQPVCSGRFAPHSPLVAMVLSPACSQRSSGVTRRQAGNLESVWELWHGTITHFYAVETFL